MAITQLHCVKILRIPIRRTFRRRFRRIISPTLFLRILTPNPNIETPITPPECAISLRQTFLPSPIIPIPIVPHHGAIPTEHPILPLPNVLVPILPLVPSLPILQPLLPLPIIEISIGIVLSPLSLLQVHHPRPLIGVPGSTNISAFPIHVTTLEFTLIGSTTRPAKPPLSHGASCDPFADIHAPICPKVLSLAMGELHHPLACVEVTVGENL
ncbi:hypothetical protein V8G54_027034, partial [Vigna mungo]